MDITGGTASSENLVAKAAEFGYEAAPDSSRPADDEHFHRCACASTAALGGVVVGCSRAARRVSAS